MISRFVNIIKKELELMKKTLFVFMFLALISPSGLFAGDTLDVAASSTTDPFTLNAAHTAGGYKVYRLARGGQYLMNAPIIDSSAAGLRIVGAAGTGARPVIQPSPDAEGAVPGILFKTTGDNTTTVFKDVALKEL